MVFLCASDYGTPHRTPQSSQSDVPDIAKAIEDKLKFLEELQILLSV